MSKPISVKRLKNNIENSRNRNEMIRILMNTLPHQMSIETNEKVWIGLEKRMLMVRELHNKYCI